MRALVRWIVPAFVAGIAVGFASGELPWPALALLVVLLAVLPPLSVAQATAAPHAVMELRRLSVYLSSMAALWTLAAVTWLAAHTSGFSPAELGLVALPVSSLAGWTAGAFAAALAMAILARHAGVRESDVLVWLIPRSAEEKLVFVGLALTAGFTEEYIFRGFLIPALDVATGVPALAVVLAVGAFAVLHAYQGVGGIIRAALLGAVLAAPFLVTGSLIPSILAHFAYDIVAGLWLADRLIRR